MMQNIAPILDLRMQGFLHIAAISHWKQVLAELVSGIICSGLYEETSFVNVGFLGSNIDYDWARYYLLRWEKFRFLFHESDLLNYEWPTLQRLYESRREAKISWYFHTKGVGGYCEIKEAWRSTMLYYLTQKHRLAIGKILDDGFDVSGVTWNRDHFSGNFWYANSDYLERLIAPCVIRENPLCLARYSVPGSLVKFALDEPSHRHLCESWIGLENPHFFELLPKYPIWSTDQRYPK